MTTTWKAHLNAYLLDMQLELHPRVPYKTAQKRASKTYQKMKKDGTAKTSSKSFFGWGGKETIDSEKSFRQYLEKHKKQILRQITPELFDLDFHTNCLSTLPIFFGEILEPGALFQPSLSLEHLCQVFYETFKPHFRHISQKLYVKRTK